MPFRQLGQYEDVETGLYYNRFRYYDPNTGLYISKDPIGLLGSFALYGYVKDSNCEIDPLGLFKSVLGFKSFGQLRQFGEQIRATFARGGFPGSEIFMQGSAVTGFSYETKMPFDIGRISDFDVAVVNPELLKKAQNLNLAKPERLYSKPLKLADMEILGFGELASDLSQKYGREVNFRIFGDKTEISRKPNFKIQCT